MVQYHLDPVGIRQHILRITSPVYRNRAAHFRVDAVGEQSHTSLGLNRSIAGHRYRPPPEAIVRKPAPKIAAPVNEPRCLSRLARTSPHSFWANAEAANMHDYLARDNPRQVFTQRAPRAVGNSLAAGERHP
jgi:hypothetical protein